MTEFLPLEPSARERRELGATALGFLDSFIDGLSEAPAYPGMPDASILERLRARPGENPTQLAALLDTLQIAAATGIDTSAGSHLSYIPNGGLFTAALGALLGAGLNRYTGGSHGAPGAIVIEQSVVDWILSLFDLGDAAGGLLLSGGSLANFAAMVAARGRLGDDFSAGVVYTSERAHHSVAKAARLAGVAPDRVRAMPADASLRLDTTALEVALRTDEQAGLRPMAVVGSAGTTDTGTIDPLPVLAGLAHRHGAWFHVDAAYGGFFQLTARGRDRLTGIDLADSVTLDAHKSLFMPYGIGCLLVRDRRALIAAHEGRGAYMQDVQDLEAVPNYFAMGPELTRPFRGLPVWMALHLHGVTAFRRELDRMLDMAERAQRELDDIDGVETVTTPDLSIVAFRATEGDDESKRLFDYVNASQLAHISSTTINGRFVLRLAFLNHRTTDQTLDSVLHLLKRQHD
jgi:aromatic-L-amino-acid decarboxylase